MSNQKQQAAKSPKAKKLLLFPGDKLIEVLNPDLYIIVDPSTLTQAEIQGIQDDNEEILDDVEEEIEQSPDVSIIRTHQYHYRCPITPRCRLTNFCKLR